MDRWIKDADPGNLHVLVDDWNHRGLPPRQGHLVIDRVLKMVADLLGRGHGLDALFEVHGRQEAADFLGRVSGTLLLLASFLQLLIGKSARLWLVLLFRVVVAFLKCLWRANLIAVAWKAAEIAEIGRASGYPLKTARTAAPQAESLSLSSETRKSHGPSSCHAH